ncbi:c-type cytochrome [Flavicella sediminum]|uniref:c-type cytochrome n=1 Tax=Flavicella sediminum TaxID=2585141 RepID=UPI00111DF698|nr:cytochrome c [Flavicella sediminum]
MNRKSKKRGIALFLVLSSFCFSGNSQTNIKAGKGLFNANCVACHRLDKKLIGPALIESTEKRTFSWFKEFVSDNAKMRAKGDKEALAIFKAFNGIPMPAYPQFSEKDMANIYAYIKSEKK